MYTENIKISDDVMENIASLKDIMKCASAYVSVLKHGDQVEQLQRLCCDGEITKVILSMEEDAEEILKDIDRIEQSVKAFGFYVGRGA